MTQDEKDQFALLEMGSNDCHGLYEVNYEFRDINRSIRALKSLYEQGFIDFFWTPADLSKGEIPLSREDSNELVKSLDNGQCFSNNDLESGYYSFLTSDAGDDFCRNNPDFQNYIRTEWSQTHVWQKKSSSSSD